MKKFIEKELKSLGIYKKYMGHRLIRCATLLVIENEDRLRHVVKDIYEPTVQIVRCKTKQVERNIRTMIFKAWDINRNHLQEIAGVELMALPTVSELIEYLADYVKENFVITS